MPSRFMISYLAISQPAMARAWPQHDDAVGCRSPKPAGRFPAQWNPRERSGHIPTKPDFHTWSGLVPHPILRGEARCEGCDPLSDRLPRSPESHRAPNVNKITSAVLLSVIATIRPFSRARIPALWSPLPLGQRSPCFDCGCMTLWSQGSQGPHEKKRKRRKMFSVV